MKRAMKEQREHVSTVRVVRRWQRLSREVVEALTLKTLKVRLYRATSNLI